MENDLKNSSYSTKQRLNQLNLPLTELFEIATEVSIKTRQGLTFAEIWPCLRHKNSMSKINDISSSNQLRITKAYIKLVALVV